MHASGEGFRLFCDDFNDEFGLLAQLLHIGQHSWTHLDHPKKVVDDDDASVSPSVAPSVALTESTVATNRSVVSGVLHDPLQFLKLYTRCWSGLLSYMGCTESVVVDPNHKNHVAACKEEFLKDKFQLILAHGLGTPEGLPLFMNGGVCGGPATMQETVYLAFLLGKDDKSVSSVKNSLLPKFANPDSIKPADQYNQKNVFETEIQKKLINHMPLQWVLIMISPCYLHLCRHVHPDYVTSHAYYKSTLNQLAKVFRAFFNGSLAGDTAKQTVKMALAKNVDSTNNEGVLLWILMKIKEINTPDINLQVKSAKLEWEEEKVVRDGEVPHTYRSRLEEYLTQLESSNYAVFSAMESQIRDDLIVVYIDVLLLGSSPRSFAQLL